MLAFLSRIKLVDLQEPILGFVSVGRMLEEESSDEAVQPRVYEQVAFAWERGDQRKQLVDDLCLQPDGLSVTVCDLEVFGRAASKLA